MFIFETYIDWGPLPYFLETLLHFVTPKMGSPHHNLYYCYKLCGELLQTVCILLLFETYIDWASLSYFLETLLHFMTPKMVCHRWNIYYLYGKETFQFLVFRYLLI